MVTRGLLLFFEVKTLEITRKLHGNFVFIGFSNLTQERTWDGFVNRFLPFR